jgi:hypothetical protein
MPGLDPAAIDRIVSALDLELAKRRTRRDEAEDQRWAIEFGGDEVILFAKRLERQFDRRKPGAKVSPPDRDAVERVEQEVVELVDLAGHIELLERRREDLANGVVERRPKPTMRVKSMAKLLPQAPRRDPSAPKPAERSGRRGEGLPAMVTGQPIVEDPIWLKGQILTWNPRTHQGSVRSQDGREYPLAAGILMRSGLTTLIVEQKCEFRAVGSEADMVRAAWH